MRDPIALWSNVDLAPRHAGVPTAPLATPARDPTIDEPWASTTPLQAAAEYCVDQPKIIGGARRKARWTDKTRSQFVAAARLLEKSYGSKPLWRLMRSDMRRLNKHFSRLPQSHHKLSRHDLMTLEQVCLEAEGRIMKKRG